MATSTLWKNRNFTWLIGGQTVSEFGASISNFAVPWLLLQLTGSALQMGLAFAVGFLPYLILSLPAGAWADRLNRKHMMMFADSGRMLLVLSIPLTSAFHALTVWQLYAVQAASSALSALFDAAYVSSLPSVVAREQLQSANAALQTGVSASQLIGPALAGTLIAVFGAANTIFINSATYFISVVSLFAIHGTFKVTPSAATHRNDAVEPTTPPASLWSQIAEGLKYVWNHRLIRVLSIFTMIGNLSSSAINAILLYHLHRDLLLSAKWVGIILTGFSVGTIVGSLLIGQLTKLLRTGVLMSIALALQVLPPVVLVFARNPIAITLANSIFGLAAVVWNVQSISLRQSVIPNHLLGRASSAIRMIAWASIPLGSAVGGAMGQWLGAATVFATGALLQASLWVAGRFIGLYKMDRMPMDSVSATELSV